MEAQISISIYVRAHTLTHTHTNVAPEINFLKVHAESFNLIGIKSRKHWLNLMIIDLE